jgi:PAS domain S-box-containing protein
MTAGEKVNILMVDDEPSKLLSYEIILAELGENLIKATSASEALSILLKHDIAVILMDVSMPELDGFELANIIREHPRFQKTAIIFISGVHLTESDKVQGYRSGAVDYISVPVIPDVLRAKVSVFVELHRKRRELEVLNNVLEQRVAERTEELRLREGQFRMRAALLELASEAIMVRDLDGKVQFWNSGAERLYGWRRDEVFGKVLHQVLQTEFPIAQQDIEAILRDQKSWQGNVMQKTSNGTEIVVACRKTLNHEGNAILEVSREITDQLRAEEMLRETEKLAAMGRVAGIIAHEINNPLAAITNIFYLLRNHSSLDQEARRLAELAEQELQRVSHITRQTLTFYRESKQPVSVCVNEVLDDVLDLQERALQANHIEVQKRYQYSCTMKGFPVEIRQVFLNLIGNAIQAMQNGGVLRLYVHEATERLTQRTGASISIVDTGIGISPEDAKRLFEPFFSTKSTKGTGLGLWISKGIVQKYDGCISYRSYRHGGRTVTCFRIFLPSNEIPKSNGGSAKRLKIEANSSSHGATPQSASFERGISIFASGQISTTVA